LFCKDGVVYLINKMEKLICNERKVFVYYEEELKQVEIELSKFFDSSVFLLQTIGNYIVQSGGKRIRPLFLLLSSELCGYTGYARIILASIIEAIHTASLLHDDVVDNADMRRGKPTAHSIWGNQIVVLVGDFLYSNALRVAVQQRSQEIMDTLSEATTKMTEGEILQLSKIGDPDISEQDYYNIISAKTGALMSAACRIGAILGKISKEYEEALAEFGMKVGIAFQMADDILDYMAKESELGKIVGKDIQEGKLTMPIFQLLKVCNQIERKQVRELIKSKNNLQSEKFNFLGKLFEKYNVIEKSFDIASSMIRDAKNKLDIFESSEVKEYLFCLADYTLYRRH